MIDINSESISEMFFTIVTATLNASNTIERCIDSVAGQNFRDFEHIVVDGASTDGTAEYLASRRECFSKLISERDLGIYNAWNKALQHASGEWILFLGSDDALADCDVLFDIHAAIPGKGTNGRLVYGDIMYVSTKDYSGLLYVSRPLDAICKSYIGVRYILPPHQAVFHHRSLFRDYGLFDESYKISADSKFLMDVLTKEPCCHIPRLVNKVTRDGISSKIQLTTYHENLRAMIELGLTVPVRNRIAFGFKIYLKYFLYRTLGRRITYAIINIYHRLQGKPALRGK